MTEPAPPSVSGRGTPPGPIGSRVARVLRPLPPGRLVWIFLLALGAYGTYLLHGLGTLPLIVVPSVAVGIDLVFQLVRFPRPRFPDAALATGFFVALIFPPTAPLVFAGAAVTGGIALRHILRTRGRPWFNPAVASVVAGTVLLGLAPAWWVGFGPYGEVLVLALGIALLLRAPARWRLPVVFLAAYAGFVVLQHVVFGATTDPRVLALGAFDPTTLFFVLFMVPEPRTAPAEPSFQVLYAGIGGIASAFLPIVLPTLGLLVGLAVANLAAVALRRAAADDVSRPVRSSRGAARRAARTGARRRDRWPVAYRVTAAVFVVTALAVVMGVSPGVSSGGLPIVRVTAPGGGSGTSTAACSTDNPSISSSNAAELHKLLGPSVLLSYDPSTGVVVFYDPVNQVTVTESDLYEDYGYAEFNGDDYAVSGCAP